MLGEILNDQAKMHVIGNFFLSVIGLDVGRNDIPSDLCLGKALASTYSST